MKNKKFRSFLSLLLLLSLLAALVIPAFAAETAEPPEQRVVHIRSLKDFTELQENCVQDLYSQGLTVSLEVNLDLGQLEYTGIPIFCGIFRGNRHTISGIRLTADGSHQGFFRYLTRDALVENLNLEGELLPEGSRSAIGGIAGVNAGTIRGCAFTGTVQGTDHIGGIAGINQVSGIIESCRVAGAIRGSHFAGCIAGSNQGTLRLCRSSASVNVESQDNTIRRVNLSPDFFTGKESVETVTDLGGVAGTSTGVIRDCVNEGNVGYPHMGYNIGGVAGSQRGYITDCTNYGSISGRKEVGGIAGQLEPAAKVTYTQDTLQILRGQLQTTSALASRAASNIHGGANDISADISSLHNEANSAFDAVEELIPSDGKLPDKDAFIAANNVLSGSLSSMQNISHSLRNSLEATVSTAAGDIQGIIRQVNAMSHTLDTAAENLGGSVTDVSDLDTEDDYSAKISDCRNQGEILGDLNISGVVGAIAWENDKDLEDDFQITGERSLNFDSQLRAVVLRCSNEGPVTAKKCCAGGIAGNMTLGLVRDSVNTGLLGSDAADYMGGIAGISNGFIRSCSSKSRIQGSSHLGGIAGQASVVTDCRSIVQILDGKENLGSILGQASVSQTVKENSIADNFYLPLSDHLGAIDGIDYHAVADSLTKKEFMALPQLDKIFRNAVMTFRYPDGTTKKLTVSLGKVVDPDRIPPLPEKEGYLAQWDHLEEIDLRNVFLDGTLEVEFTPCHTVAQSDLLRDDGKPVLLANGEIGTAQGFSLYEAEDLPDKALEGWILPEFETGDGYQVRLSIPDAISPKAARAMVQDNAGSWQEAEARLDGTYLVFPVSADDRAVAVWASHEAQRNMILTAAGCILILALLITLLALRKKRKKAGKK